MPIPRTIDPYVYSVYSVCAIRADIDHQLFITDSLIITTTAPASLKIQVENLANVQ